MSVRPSVTVSLIDRNRIYSNGDYNSSRMGGVDVTVIVLVVVIRG